MHSVKLKTASIIARALLFHLEINIQIIQDCFFLAYNCFYTTICCLLFLNKYCSNMKGLVLKCCLILSLLVVPCSNCFLNVLTIVRVRVSGPNFIILTLPSVLILVNADPMLNDSLCCSNKYN